MEIEFENEELAEIFQGHSKPKGYQPFVINAFIKTVRMLEASRRVVDLYKFNSLKFKRLEGKMNDFFAVRVNDQYRLEFKIRSENDETVISVYKLSNHYK